MPGDTYLCQQCRNIFTLPMTCNILPQEEKEEVICPGCGSVNVEELPSWAPIGFTEGSLMWEYECQQCQSVFMLPIPTSPSQEKEIKCPTCGGGHIHRLTSVGGQPLYCG